MATTLSPRAQSLLQANTDARARLHELGFRPCVGDIVGDMQSHVFRQAGVADIRVLMSGTARQTIRVEQVSSMAANDSMKTLWKGNFADFAAAPVSELGLQTPVPVLLATVDMLYRAGFTIASEQDNPRQQTLIGQLPLENIRAQLSSSFLVIQSSALTTPYDAKPEQPWHRILTLNLGALFGPRTADASKTALAKIFDQHASAVSLHAFLLPQRRIDLA